MKKLVSILCAIAMVCSLAACSGGSGGSDEITTIGWYVPLSSQSDIASVMEEAAKITEPLIGARLDIQTIDTSAYAERMNMNMASGSEFDLCFTGYVNTYISAAKRGGLLDITEMLDEQTPDLKASIPDYAWDAATIDGKIYAVPNLQGFCPPNSLKFKKYLLDKYNFDVSTVKKMEDVEPFLEIIHQNEPTLYPISFSYATQMWTGGIYEDIEGAPGIAIRADGSSPEVFYMVDTPEYQQGLKTMQEWFQKGYYRPDLLSSTTDAADMRAGKFAVSEGGWLPGAEATEKLGNGGYDPVFVQMMKPYLTKTKALATMIGIGQGSKNAEKSLKMIELMNTNDELYNLIAYGIEGKHYTFNDEHKVVINEDAGYKPNSAWMFGNQFNAFVLEGQDDDVWEQTEKLNNDAIKSPLIEFVFDTDPVKNEISQVTAVGQEFNVKGWVVNGTGNWDEYITKLDQAGRGKILEEVQRQVNEFWETKDK